ncbi:MAG: tetratricopeptide repeat protein [Candidatus Riflebacteria bacterium]|nr:tetratricopeptide repeat protein [Candidatus Riflebacteria bacterium]
MYCPRVAYLKKVFTPVSILLLGIISTVWFSAPQVLRAASVDESKYVLPSLKNSEAKILFRKAMGFLDDGQIHFAITNLQTALTKEADNAELLAKTGLLAIDAGESYLKLARTCFDKLFEVKKGVGAFSPEEIIGYSRSLFLVEPLKLDDAEKNLKEVLQKTPDNLNAQIAMAELGLIKSKFQESLDLFSKAKSKKSDEPRIAWGMGYALLGLGKKEEAIDAFNEAYATAPNDAKNNVKMGKAMLDLGKNMMAEKYYSLAVKIDKNCIGGHLGIAYLKLFNNEDMSASFHIKNVLDLDPQNPRVYLCRGIYNEMRKDLPAAIEDYRLAASLGSDMVEAKLRLGKILAGVGHAFPGGTFTNENAEGRAEYRRFARPKEAVQILREVLKLSPNHPENTYIKSLIESLED